MARAFVFPGQGSQAVGMQADLADHPAGKAVFDEVSSALDQDLTALMADGPAEDLTLTENAQPALMAVSLAVVRVLEAETGQQIHQLGDFIAGHSLGEYSALAAGGAFSLADAARLLKIRGRSMQAAVPVGAGAMAAVIGLEAEQVAAVAKEARASGVCEIANDNGGGQIVLSGSREGVEAGARLAEEAGARKAVMLDVSAPFHCSLMQPAADAMQAALADVEINAPSIPLIANVTAEVVTDPDDIRQRLVEQVTGTVRWRECVLTLAGRGVSDVYEVGSGRVLMALIRRIERQLKAKSLNSVADVVEAKDAIMG